ncbi:MAG: hypothetical protein JO140_01110 [Candidatus Eremiobacteraeota bacterium]|nr:hypothetical protein [Candidatus Eremiobacteraeota bacterium]
MSTLKQTVVVDTPFAQAADLVEKFFVSQADPQGTIVMRLAAPGGGLGIKGFLLERDVTATFRRKKGPNETIVFALHWESADRGPFPVFDGTLSVAQDEGYGSCRLILAGSYTPPGWVAGAAFDATLGSKIARATAKELLARMSTFLGTGYDEIERRKRAGELLAHGG